MSLIGIRLVLGVIAGSLIIAFQNCAPAPAFDSVAVSSAGTGSENLSPIPNADKIPVDIIIRVSKTKCIGGYVPVNGYPQVCSRVVAKIISSGEVVLVFRLVDKARSVQCTHNLFSASLESGASERAYNLIGGCINGPINFAPGLEIETLGFGDSATGERKLYPAAALRSLKYQIEE